MGANDLSEKEFLRVYGPWRSRTPQDVADLFAGYPGVWWVAGGWAIEAFTGVSREHDDTDPGVLRSELHLLRAHLSGRLDVWANTEGSLRALLPGEGDDVVPAGTHQLWLRASALDPWEYDVLMEPGTPETWVFRRDESITMPMSDAVWECDGVRYVSPEIQLLYKSRAMRPKDEVDLEVTLPLLDRHRRDWLGAALDRTRPGHPWLARL